MTLRIWWPGEKWSWIVEPYTPEEAGYLDSKGRAHELALDHGAERQHPNLRLKGSPT